MGRTTFHKKSRTRHAAGFTLIEALLAGLVLAMTGVVIGGAVMQSLRTASVGRNIQVAAALLDRTMTRIDMIGPARLMVEGPLSGRFDPPHQRFTWSASIESLAEPDLYQIALTVTWPTADGQRSARLVTRLYDPPGSRDASVRWEDL